MKKHCVKLLTCAAILALALGPVGAATVTAVVDPPQIAMGDTAQLTVTVSGAQEQPSVPTVDGLEITRVGQSTQIEFVNGAMTANASSTYEITPQRDGTFTIPAIHAGGAASQPVSFRVSAGGLAPAPALAAPSAGPSAAAGGGPVVQPAKTPAPDTSAAPQNKYGALEVTLPRDRNFYEGELVPADVRLLLPAHIRLEGIDVPQISSDGFTTLPLSNKPASQTEEVIEGRSYSVFTWHTALAAAKTGEYPLNLSVHLNVIVPQRMPQLGDDDSFNSFFRNAMSSFGQQKTITLTGNNLRLRVDPLPKANRPADFNGAVGQFQIETSADPKSVTAGDPVTLRMKVTGHGNFGRVTSGLLPGDANWKTYPPKSNFSPQDPAGYEGEKTFEQPIIANNGSVTSVPPISFSFFDPELGQYVTRTAPALAITVSGAPAVPAPAPSAPAVAGTAPAPGAPAVTGPDLRPNKLESGPVFATLRPVYLQPLFIGAQAVPLLALLGGLAFVRRNRLRTEPDRVRASQSQAAIRRELSALDVAMEQQKANEFFVHARNALQQRFGREWAVRPEAITLADIESRRGLASDNVRSIFQMADQASYSGLHFEEADLRQWRQVVLNELGETTT